MDQNPLVNNLIEEGTKFLAEFQKHYALKTAFWLKERDRENSHLYIAASDITDENLYDAYGKALDIAQDLCVPAFDPFRVKLIDENHPLAKAALAFRERSPVPSIVAFQDEAIDGRDIEWALIYRLPIPDGTVASSVRCAPAVQGSQSASAGS